MNRDQFIEAVKAFRDAYGLQVQDVLVMAGGAMIMRGWREETGDLDCTVEKSVYDRLVAQGHPTKALMSGDVVEVPEFLVEASVAHSEQDFDLIDGVAVQTIKDLVQFKQQLNRVKDRADLELIFKNMPTAQSVLN